MINAKRILAASLLVASVLTSGATTIANAGTKWDKGLYDGHNDYYFAYSYYYHGDEEHYSWAKLGSSKSGNCYAPADETSIAETDSLYKTKTWSAGKGIGSY